MNTAVKEVQVIKATITGEKTEKIRVAAYCRVSTDKDDQLNSFFAQMRYYRDYVRGNDKMVLVDIYHRSERRNENTRKHLKEGKSETSVSDFFL